MVGEHTQVLGWWCTPTPWGWRLLHRTLQTSSSDYSFLSFIINCNGKLHTFPGSVNHLNNLSNPRGVMGAPKFVVGRLKCRRLKTPFVVGIRGGGSP